MQTFDSSATWCGEARVLAMSQGHSSTQEPLVTLEVTRMPKVILGELARHRCASLSVASARAIPESRVIEQVIEDPFIPCDLRAAARSMESQGVVSARTLQQAQTALLKMRDNAVVVAKELSEAGVHKQHVNRVLEPFMRVNLVLSTTELSSILLLRMAPDVQPEFLVTAGNIASACLFVTPKRLKTHVELMKRTDADESTMCTREWHLPYLSNEERQEVNEAYCTIGPQSHKIITRAIIRSVARCARATYARNGDVYSLERDAAVVRLLKNSDDPREFSRVGWDYKTRKYARLPALTTQCFHASPFEHVAQVSHHDAMLHGSQGGNFGSDYAQLRHCAAAIDMVMAEAEEIGKQGVQDAQ